MVWEALRKFEAFETRRHHIKNCFHFTYGTLINPHRKLSPAELKKYIPMSLFQSVIAKNL